MLISSKINEIKDMFELFDDPMDKYTQIIELGKKNIPLQNKYKNEENRIYGCTSLAWVRVTKENNTYTIFIDSDTFIVKGLLSIIKYIIDGSEAKQIETLNIQSILSDIGLEESITSQRTNGFLNALEMIKTQIKKYE
ncbi:MAG: Fe-S metabolism associated SufE [Candidatus Marinimicrobia bacterium]|nr:Fe-S metabolism associated SufE [Candidatus Neomarinimicrobiota bacterium]|tara:strand:+ start:2558 stop:2971 length:414 start_codon:yes stop_codon:yes gene_type:complete